MAGVSALVSKSNVNMGMNRSSPVDDLLFVCLLTLFPAVILGWVAMGMLTDVARRRRCLYALAVSYSGKDPTMALESPEVPRPGAVFGIRISVRS
jgi:hypothetical protein